MMFDYHNDITTKCPRCLRRFATMTENGWRLYRDHKEKCERELQRELDCIPSGFKEPQ